MKTSEIFTGRFFIFLLTLVVFFGLSSCKKNKKAETPVDDSPTACFATSSVVRKVKEIATFQNCSKNYERCEWNYGDGTTGSVLSEPSWFWINKGLYPVTLNVFKGTVKSGVSKNILVVDNGVKIYLNATFKRWKPLPSKYISIKITALLVKTTLPNDPGQPFGSLPMIVENLNQDIKFQATTDYVLDASTTYKIKLEITGIYRDQNSVSQSEHLDSFTTDEIDLITGAKTPVGSSSTSITDIDFTLTSFAD